jgi:hypothetical protein
MNNGVKNLAVPRALEIQKYKIAAASRAHLPPQIVLHHCKKASFIPV